MRFFAGFSAVAACVSVLASAGLAWAGPGGGSLWRHFACDFHAPRASQAASSPSRNDHRCVGLTRGRQALLAKVRDVSVQRAEATSHDPVVDAGAYFVGEAAPYLRTIVQRHVAAKDQGTHEALELVLLRARASEALAALDDKAAAPMVAAFVREQENDNVGFSYRDSLAALASLDPDLAGRYVADALGRLQPGGAMRLDHRVRELLPHAALGGAAARRALERMTGNYKQIPMSLSHDYCLVMAARLASGDEALATEVRKSARGSYSGTWLATCDGVWFGALLGRSPDDADILVRHMGRPDLGMDSGMAHLAYDRTITLLAAMRSMPPARVAAARATLKKGLAERSGWPHVADKNHRNYSPKLRAAHFAALASLGDESARAKVLAMIDDREDRTGAEFWAAAFAVELGVAGATERAALALERGVGFEDDGPPGVPKGRDRLVDALVARGGDAGWAVALFEADALTRRRAMFHFFRKKPVSACSVVARVAPNVHDEAAEDGFWALAALGDGCARAVEATARNASLPAAVRGMALELGAMGRAGYVPELVQADARAKGKGHDTFYGAFVQRAELVYRVDP